MCCSIFCPAMKLLKVLSNIIWFEQIMLINKTIKRLSPQGHVLHSAGVSCTATLQLVVYYMKQQHMWHDEQDIGWIDRHLLDVNACQSVMAINLHFFT